MILEEGFLKLHDNDGQVGNSVNLNDLVLEGKINDSSSTNFINVQAKNIEVKVALNNDLKVSLITIYILNIFFSKILSPHFAMRAFQAHFQSTIPPTTMLKDK